MCLTILFLASIFCRDPSWGGAFYWHPAKTLADGYHYPKFNTLLLFLPTVPSIHSVTAVSDRSTGKSKRLALGGWYNKGGDGEPFIEKPIEDMYMKKEDHIRLTSAEANFIARNLDEEAVETAYPERSESLKALRESVIKNYLYPIHESVALFESIEDDEEEGGGEGK